MTRAQDNWPIVEAQEKTGAPWKKYRTRRVADLPGYSPKNVPVCPYGGRSDLRGKATGFFRTEKANGRWWLVDPDGHPFIYRGVSDWMPGRSETSKSALTSKYGSEEGWANGSVRELRDAGFVGACFWSKPGAAERSNPKLVRAQVLNWMADYGRHRGGAYQQTGHTGFPQDCIFVFDPEFKEFCQTKAEELRASRDDPWVLGYYSDNELPFPFNALDRFLQLGSDSAGFNEAQRWLNTRKGRAANAGDIATADRQEFLKFLAERYFQICAEAIRAQDPHHLYLGCRFYGPDLGTPQLFEAAGKYVDVLSVNWYGTWTPDNRPILWEKWSGKPVLITEWYVKGEDSGLGNTTGAGWTVRTQADRGLFYQNFTLGLLQNRVCVGWDWFKYMDNDPEDPSADPSNRDANKGVVSNRYVPYSRLLESMRLLNGQVYSIADQFDAASK